MPKDSTIRKDSVETTIALPRELMAKIHRGAVSQGVGVQAVTGRLVRVGLEMQRVSS